MSLSTECHSIFQNLFQWKIDNQIERIYHALPDLKITDLKNICKFNKNLFKGYSYCTKKINIMNHIIYNLIPEYYICLNTIDEFRNFTKDIIESRLIINFINMINEYNTSYLSFENIDDDEDTVENSVEINNILSEIKYKYINDYYFQYKPVYNIFFSNIYKLYLSEYKQTKNQIIYEQYLYHGTDHNNIQSILEDDFSLTIHSSHGQRFGKGIYFTNDINLALKYSEKYKNKKYVLLCSVHIGDTVQGKYKMDLLPMNPSTNRRYDTAVDNISNPKQFVKFKNHQYLIMGILEVDIFNKQNIMYYDSNNLSRSNIRQQTINTNHIQRQNMYRANIKIYNHSQDTKYIYWNIKKLPSVSTISSKDLENTRLYKKMGDINPKSTYSVKTNIDDRFVIVTKYTYRSLYLSSMKCKFITITQLKQIDVIY